MGQSVWDRAAEQLLAQANLKSLWFCRLESCDGNPHGPDHHFCEHPLDSPYHVPACRHARTNQRPPSGEWLCWMIRSGRGFGKTRSGSEYINDRFRRFGARRAALVARSAADVRDVMVEGESGILAVAARHHPHPKVSPSALSSARHNSSQPIYEPTKRRITFVAGGVATTFTAEEPSLLRGPEHDLAWCDELSSWTDAPLGDRLDTAFNNLMLGLRLGSSPRCVITTTPKPNKLTREISKRPSTRVTIGSTYENLTNLAPSFREQILTSYEGTRIGRQELMGEMLEDIEGALFHLSNIDASRGELVAA